MSRSIRELTDAELKDRERRHLIALGEIRAEQDRRKNTSGGTIDTVAATSEDHAVS